MHPYLLDFGLRRLPLVGQVHLFIPTYGVLVATAMLVGWFWTLRNARRAGLDLNKAATAVFWTLVAGIIGGKLGLVLVEARTFIADPRQLLSIDFVRTAGVVWIAVLAGAGALVLATRRLGLPTPVLLDAVAVPLPVSQAIGRIGCLMAGCCYGRECRLPWAVVYHSPEAQIQTGVPLGQPLHPSPVYEALWCLLVVLPGLLWLRRQPGRAPGELAAAYLVLYGVGRFLVEFTRGDAIRGLWFGGTLSTSQLLSLLAAPAGAAIWVALRRRQAAGRPA